MTFCYFYYQLFNSILEALDYRLNFLEEKKIKFKIYLNELIKKNKQQHTFECLVL